MVPFVFRSPFGLYYQSFQSIIYNCFGILLKMLFLICFILMFPILFDCCIVCGNLSFLTYADFFCVILVEQIKAKC